MNGIPDTNQKTVHPAALTQRYTVLQFQTRGSRSTLNSMYRIGAVSYLNAKPLIDGLNEEGKIALVVDVPSRLLNGLMERQTCAALCPVIDYQRASRALRILPVGAIGSHGPTLTVRVFSSKPFDLVEEVHVDTDSHTSVALLQVIFNALYSRIPKLIPASFRDINCKDINHNHRDTVLLIGDKVITAEPESSVYPYQIDLGEAWSRITGLPFVFATWMTTPGQDLGNLPQLLAARRIANARRIDNIVETQAPLHGWPAALAREYLGQLIQYEIGENQLAAMELFWKRCHEIGVISVLRPLVLYQRPEE